MSGQWQPARPSATCRLGGAVLLYGFGHIDPDPAVYDDAPAIIEKWSPSIDLFLRMVPETKAIDHHHQPRGLAEMAPQPALPPAAQPA